MTPPAPGPQSVVSAPGYGGGYQPAATFTVQAKEVQVAHQVLTPLDDACVSPGEVAEYLEALRAGEVL